MLYEVITNNFLDTDKASALFWGYTAMLVSMDVYHRNVEEEEPDKMAISVEEPE